MVIMALFSTCGLKDIISEKEPGSKRKSKELLKQVKTEFKSEAGYAFLVTIFGSVACKMYEVVYGQFGTVFITDLFEKQGNTVTETQDLLKWASLLQTLVKFTFVLIVGKL